MRKLNIHPSEILQIEELFQSKGWEIEADNAFKISLYQKFIDRYERLSKDDRPLYLELSQKFLRIKDTAIYSLFKQAYNSIYDDYLKGFRKIFIMPLVNPYINISEGKNKVVRPKMKSGEKIKVFLQSNEYRELQYSEKIEMPDTFDELKRAFIANQDLLILIDDFIGSGRTANDILDVIFKESKFDDYNTLILALICQFEGGEKIYEEHKVISFFHYHKKKGITDFYSSTEAHIKLNQAISMEKTLKVPSKYSLGYGRSEALVSIMNKSPNNTFPVFWYETNKMAAPFHRYVKYNKNGG